MYLGSLKRWAALIVLSLLLWYLWPALSARVYDPAIYDPLKQVRLVENF